MGIRPIREGRGGRTVVRMGGSEGKRVKRGKAGWEGKKGRDWEGRG